MSKQFFLIKFMLVAMWSWSQSSTIGLNKDTYHDLDRMEILGLDSGSFHTSVKPYRSSWVNDVTVDSNKAIDVANLSYYQDKYWVFTDSSTSSERTLLKYFYQNPFAFYGVNEELLKLSINPVLNFQGGYDVSSSQRLSINTRGIEIEGLIDDKIAFYSFIGENQMFVPQYVSDRILDAKAVPQENFWKLFKDTGYDFFTARGYVDFNITKHIAFQFGQDRNFIGNGYRSMILSDYAGTYPYAKLQTKIWKFNYTNLYAKLTADIVSTAAGPPAGSEIYGKKWLSIHHLSLDITKNINIGVFESVMSGAHDSTGRSSFEIDYLNPVIFYRSIEQNLGSQGNAMIGVDFKWNMFNTLSLYGQVVLDEFHLSNLIARDGWWANKQALQAGLKYIDAVGIRNLDMQLEYNYSRPFMYSHASSYTNYSHYNMPLAHPMGANFEEYIAILRYQPVFKLNFVGKVIVMKKGEDPSDNISYGGDIQKSYNLRAQEYGNVLGQGVLNNVVYLSLRASYLLRPNLYIDLLGVMRKEDSSDDLQDNTSSSINIGLRLNIASRLYDY